MTLVAAEFDLVKSCLLDLGGILGGRLGSDLPSEPDPLLGGLPGGISLSIHLGILSSLSLTSLGLFSFEKGFSESFRLFQGALGG